MHIDKIKAEAEKAGYEMAHAQESYGEHAFGLLIFVQMSNRRLLEEDSSTFYRAADAIKKGVERVSALNDPQASEKRKRYLDEVKKIYKYAGIDTVYIEAIPNGYCKDPCCLNTPWFRVTTAIGHVVIGWRKSVMSIDWKDTIVKKTGEELVSYDNVTRWETGIHAYGAGKATEYIRRLHQEGAAVIEAGNHK